MNPQAAFPGPYGQMPPGVPFPGYPPYGPPFMHPQGKFKINAENILKKIRNISVEKNFKI